MPNPLAIVAPSLALTVIKESIGLCQSILSYRQQAMQVELAREQMHTQANMHMAQLQAEFEKDIAQIQGLSQAFHLTLKATRKETKSKAALAKRAEKQIDQIIKLLDTDGTPVEVRLGLNQTLQLLVTQQGTLLSDLNQNNTQAINAFAIFADSMRTSPRTFTDVR